MQYAQIYPPFISIYVILVAPCKTLQQVTSQSLTWRHTPSRDVTSHSLTWRDVTLSNVTWRHTPSTSHKWHRVKHCNKVSAGRNRHIVGQNYTVPVMITDRLTSHTIVSVSGLYWRSVRVLTVCLGTRKRRTRFWLVEIPRWENNKSS